MAIKNSFYNIESTGQYHAPKILEHDIAHSEFKSLKEIIQKFDHKNDKRPDFIRPKNISVLELYDVYCEELKTIINLNNFKELVESILKLEDELILLTPLLTNINKEDFPTINNIYQLITPLILRTFLAFNFEKIDDIKSIEKRWMESLRVSIEEEFFKYKEKIIDLQSSKRISQ